MARHPNKHIRESIEYAETRGWRLIKASGHAHIWENCYVRSVLVMAAYSTFIPLREVRKPMPAGYNALLITVTTLTEVPK